MAAQDSFLFRWAVIQIVVLRVCGEASLMLQDILDGQRAFTLDDVARLIAELGDVGANELSYI